MVAVLYCFLNSDVSPELLMGQSTHAGCEVFPKVPPTWTLPATAPGLCRPPAPPPQQPRPSPPSAPSEPLPTPSIDGTVSPELQGGPTKGTCSLSACPGRVSQAALPSALSRKVNHFHAP